MRRFVASLFILFYLILQVPLQMDFHVCRGSVMDFAFWKDAEVCDHHLTETWKSSCSSETLGKKGCCNDVELEFFQVTEVLPKVSYSDDVSDDETLHHVIVHPSYFSFVRVDYTAFTSYIPPPMYREVFLWIQSFLL